MLRVNNVVVRLVLLGQSAVLADYVIGVSKPSRGS
jgi:hypothetical protein